MADRPGSIVALNAGSSSVKFALFGDEPALPLRSAGQIDAIGQEPALTLRGPDGQPVNAPPVPPDRRDHAGLIAFLLNEVVAPAAGEVIGVGHRVVHGGTEFSGPVRVTPEVVAAIERLAPLAQSHQPHNLAGIRAARSTWPDVPQIACFDTAFHRTLPEAEALFAIPLDLAAEGVRRYGFHGLSYEAIARQLPEHLGPLAEGRVVVAHLGNGASLCGMVELRSRTTTMGFTPLDGLVMGRRPGRLDPGVLLYLMTAKSMGAKELSQLLNRESGLAGISGGVSDMRDLLASDDTRAQLAVDMFVNRLVAEIGAAAATIGGLDALVFTGGIGENAPAIRARVVERLAWLGAALDPAANAAGGPDIGGPKIDGPNVRGSGSLRLLVLKTDEERMLARAVLDHLSRSVSD